MSSSKTFSSIFALSQARFFGKAANESFSGTLAGKIMDFVFVEGVNAWNLT